MPRAGVAFGVFPCFIFTAEVADEELGAFLFLMHASDAAALSSDMGGVSSAAAETFGLRTALLAATIPAV